MKYKYLNTDEMMALEKHAFENYPITFEQMMQKAGQAVFDVVINEVMYKKTESADHHPRILIVVGKGNNGGDALVAARLLHEEGIEVKILSPYFDEAFSEMVKEEMKKIRKLNIPFVEKIDNSYSLIIDALFGFSLKGNPRQPEANIIEQINCSSFGSAQDHNLHIPVLSVDVPSGLDVHNGSIGSPTIKADYTVVLGMLKKGFENHSAIVGKVYLGDLGIPEQAYRDMGYEPPMFRGKTTLSVN